MGLSIFGLFEVDVFTVIIMGVGISLFPLALDALSTFVPIGRSVQRHMSSFLVFVLVVLSLGTVDNLWVLRHYLLTDLFKHQEGCTLILQFIALSY